MNTIISIGAFVALVWLTLWAFNDLGEDAIGYACLGLTMAWLVAIFISIAEDLGDWREVRGERRRRR